MCIYREILSHLKTFVVLVPIVLVFIFVSNDPGEIVKTLPWFFFEPKDSSRTHYDYNN